MADPKRLRLQHGAFELHLEPRQGGAISAFRHDERDLLRPAGEALLKGGDPCFASCFPLVPFSNRIADARFRFQGRTYELSANFPPELHAIHGQGWQGVWQIGDVAADRTEMSFRHRVPDTPLDYRARQVFELSDDGLGIRLEVENAGGGPMPVGIGLHPYFVRTEGVTLRAKLDHVWLADERNIPKKRVPLPARWEFAKAPRLARDGQLLRRLERRGGDSLARDRPHVPDRGRAGVRPPRDLPTTGRGFLLRRAGLQRQRRLQPVRPGRSRHRRPSARGGRDARRHGPISDRLSPRALRAHARLSPWPASGRPVSRTYSSLRSRRPCAPSPRATRRCAGPSPTCTPRTRC